MSGIEEGAKVATGIVDALKASPVALAGLIFNLVFIGLVAYFVTSERQNERAQWSHVLEMMAKACGPADKK